MKSLQNVEIDNGTDQYHWHVMQRWSPWFAIALILSGISFFEPTLPSKVSSTALQDQIGAKSIVRNKHGFRFPKSKSPNNSFFNDFCCSSGIISKIKLLQKHPHVQKFTFTANQPTPSWGLIGEGTLASVGWLAPSNWPQIIHQNPTHLQAHLHSTLMLTHLQVDLTCLIPQQPKSKIFQYDKSEQEKKTEIIHQLPNLCWIFWICWFYVFCFNQLKYHLLEKCPEKRHHTP